VRSKFTGWVRSGGWNLVGPSTAYDWTDELRSRNQLEIDEIYPIISVRQRPVRNSALKKPWGRIGPPPPALLIGDSPSLFMLINFGR